MSTIDSQNKHSSEWDHSTNRGFLEYYAQQSVSPLTVGRFTRVRDKAIALLASRSGNKKILDVADIGCGAGTQCRLWAVLGHHVHGLDVSAPLIEIARQRALDDQLAIDFLVGTATDLPFEDRSIDVCLMPELLEHVADWQSCLNEAVRVLRRGGLLYVSTTNWLCPKQQEFDLPMYSWYPPFLKRKCERLAVTTHPEFVNHAKYPAVNWFSYYFLAAYLRRRGFRCLDRFDLIDRSDKGRLGRALVAIARRLPPLRFAGHVLTSGTVVFALNEC